MPLSDTDLRKMIEEFGLVDPTVKEAIKEETAKAEGIPRLVDLNGKRACFLENTMESSGIVLRRIKEVLEQRYHLADSRMWSKLWYSRPGAPALLDEIAGKCDFVISGIGL